MVNCVRGQPCGRACIPRTRICRRGIDHRPRRCVRGQPCGRTCIPIARRCRVGVQNPGDILQERPDLPLPPLVPGLARARFIDAIDAFLHHHQA